MLKWCRLDVQLSSSSSAGFKSMESSVKCCAGKKGIDVDEKAIVTAHLLESNPPDDILYDVISRKEGVRTLLKKIYCSQPQEKRILVLGLDNAGKTTLLKQLVNEDILAVTPTQGFTIKSLSQKDVKLNVWDVGGQKAMRPYWTNYFEQMDALVYVIDATDRIRLDECIEELNYVLENEKMLNVPLLIFANKQDLECSLSTDELSEMLRLSLIYDRSWKIQACSATRGEGLHEGIEWIVKQLKS